MSNTFVWLLDHISKWMMHTKNAVVMLKPTKRAVQDYKDGVDMERFQ